MGDANFQELVTRVDTLEAELKRNSEATARVEANTTDIVAAFDAASGAFKTLEWLGKVVRPIGYIATAVAGIALAWSRVKGLWK